MDTLDFSDRKKDFFEQFRRKIDVVCVGDSITGYNLSSCREVPVYPSYLQDLLGPGHLVSNCGLEGYVSKEGIDLVKCCLDLFPGSRFFVIGFGTNDLGMSRDVESTSKAIIKNLESMIQMISKRDKMPILLNILHYRFFENGGVDYHNAQLAKAFQGRHFIIDICSKLKKEDIDIRDGLHPNGYGARAIAESVYNFLKQLIRS